MSIPVGPTIYSIYVNNTLQSVFPLDVELRQSWGNHDLFFIRIEYPRLYSGIPSLQLWPDNAPVKIVWGRRPNNIQTWYGYVNHHTVDSNADSGSKATQITYICIGTSKPMNTDKTRTWNNTTPTYIARKIAGEYGFRAVLTSTNWLLPYEVQSNESDFKFLNRIADKVGYRFYVSGGTLYFIDPIVTLQGTSNSGIPVFRVDKKFTQVDTIRNFCMSKGDNIPGAVVANRTMYGIDPGSQTIFQATSNSIQDTSVNYIMNTWPAPSIQQASNLVSAWQSRSQFWLSSSAELFGNSYLYPGKMITLAGDQLPNEAAGYWLVASVTHMVKASGTSKSSSDKYVSQVTLLKNTSTILPTIKSVNKISPEFTACSLIGNSWKSADMSVLYDGVERV